MHSVEFAYVRPLSAKYDQNVSDFDDSVEFFTPMNPTGNKERDEFYRTGKVSQLLIDRILEAALNFK